MGGASGIIFAALIYAKYKNSLVKWYILTLLVWTLNELTDIVSYYIREILLIESHVLNRLLNDIAFLTLDIFAYLLPMLVYRLLRKKVKSRYNGDSSIDSWGMHFPSYL